MEPPPGDDSMEMASPYQGHMDDFDIDLDVMEDQVSEVDQDLDVADATPEPTNGPGSVNDADMVDEVDERPMIDADENNQGTVGQNENGYYQTEETYEAQMEEYDEDIDAPVPEQPDIVITDTQPDQQDTQDTTEFTGHQETIEQSRENNNEEHRDTIENPSELNVEQHDLQEQSKETEGPGPDEASKEVANVDERGEQQHGQQENDTNDSARVELPQPNLDDVESKPQAQDKEPENAQADETHVSSNQDDTPQVEEKHFHETVREEVEGSHEVSHLHPVKVLYQDSEISLFRPREGDSSETFFLEDESLAYECLGKLLSSCRNVLGEHIVEGEVLVVDIESLNLQLNEDSYHTSKVTLSQIVGLYLDLCRNDGIDEPEPLYLTLSTKLTLPAEISNLLAAAGEGKGLSHIYQWEEYEDEQQIGTSPVHGGEEEEEEEEEEEAEEQAKPESSEQTAQVEAPEPGHTEEERVDRQPASEETDAQKSPASSSHEQTNADKTVSKPTDTTDDSAHEKNEDIAPAATNDDHEQHQEDAYAGDELHGEPNEEVEPAEAEAEDEQYDFEEEASESTATLAQVSADELKLDKAAEESADQDPRDAADAGEETTDGVGDDAAGEEVHDEDHGYEDGAYEHDESQPGQYASLDASQDERSTAGHNGLSEPEKTDALSEQPLEVGDDDYDGTGEQNTAHAELSGDAQRQDGEPVSNEDLLGIDEDIFKSPAKKPRAPAGEGESAYDTHAAVIDTAAEISLHGEEDEYEELPFDPEDDYIDLGTADSAFDGEIENGKPELRESGHSGKRSRSPEDEVDLTQAPSPDAKRRRSS
ncbi:conserved glutamic acid-rich protein [Paecilomyces variotii No. 5]|uniref:Conserved glutamic acid-rich protein n=1 Tax=Byssochlamys spectabilis (strain No. 5 / NBRC 109023) TaxID=1356009 RepID=V5G142_BYSSN|nr:conserved glutamic acid-rich protein [Paecilomyces variotii No. 5]